MNRKSYLALWLVLSFFFSTVAAIAQNIAGQDDPRFMDAVDIWLEGNDAAALRALSGLAHEDNIAAQIFLGQLANDPHTVEAMTALLGRKERVSLLKKMDKPLGTSWLDVAGEKDELARALGMLAKSSFKSPYLSAEKAQGRLNVVKTLLDHKEDARAIIALRDLLSVFEGAPEPERLEILKFLISQGNQLPPELAPIIRESARSRVERGEEFPSTQAFNVWITQHVNVMNYVLWLQPYGPMKASDSAKGTFQITLDENIVAAMKGSAREVYYWRPVAQFCDKYCPSSRDMCTSVGAFSINYGMGLAPTSPVESLITNEAYWSSARIEQDLAVRTPDTQLTRFDPFFQLDSCYFESIDALRGGDP